MTATLTDCLADLYGAEVVERGRDADGYLFVGRDGVSPMSSDTPLEVVQRVQVRAGVVVDDGEGGKRAKVTFHELRHTAATVMLTAGKSLPVVAKQLGHASSKITAAVYEHLLDDALPDDALDAFDCSRIAQRIAHGEESKQKQRANPLE